jgi:hypothetical protein
MLNRLWMYLWMMSFHPLCHALTNGSDEKFHCWLEGRWAHWSFEPTVKIAITAYSVDELAMKGTTIFTIRSRSNQEWKQFSPPFCSATVLHLLWSIGEIGFHCLLTIWFKGRLHRQSLAWSSLLLPYETSCLIFNMFLLYWSHLDQFINYKLVEHSQVSTHAYM